MRSTRSRVRADTRDVRREPPPSLPPNPGIFVMSVKGLRAETTRDEMRMAEESGPWALVLNWGPPRAHLHGCSIPTRRGASSSAPLLQAFYASARSAMGGALG